MEGEESCEIVLPLFCVCLHVIGIPKMVAIAVSIVIMVFFPDVLFFIIMSNLSKENVRLCLFCPNRSEKE